MNKKTIFVIRIFFFTLTMLGAWLVALSNPDWNPYQCLTVGACIGALTILIDVLIKGFSLRGLTAISFGLAIGALVAYLLSSSPLFEKGDMQELFLVRMTLYPVCMYLATMMALRGRDEFNLVIPYFRFVPHDVKAPFIVVDASALIDGRFIGMCESRFITSAVVVPRFIVNELHHMAESSDTKRQLKGRKGLHALKTLKEMKHVDFRIEESEVNDQSDIDSKMIYVTRSLKGKLLTTDYSLAQLAEFNGIEWLNISNLAKALHPELNVGENFEIELVKLGREPTQAVGYLQDGSMVVVNEANHKIGARVRAEVVSVLPSAGGKMVFAKMSQEESN